MTSAASWYASPTIPSVEAVAARLPRKTLCWSPICSTFPRKSSCYSTDSVGSLNCSFAGSSVCSAVGIWSARANGIQIQMYCALIACLLIQLTCGEVKPNQWTYKLLCLYVQGWATEDEVIAHLRERAEAAAKKSN